MADNVVMLPKREPPELIWICDCGCSTHFHHADGGVVCATCDNVASVSDDGWRQQLPASPADPEPCRGTFASFDLSSAEAFFRRQLKAGSADVSAVIVIHDDGSASTYGKCENTAERRDWLRQCIAQAFGRMVGFKD
jgi:hypothetical protein